MLIMCFCQKIYFLEKEKQNVYFLMKRHVNKNYIFLLFLKLCQFWSSIDKSPLISLYVELPRDVAPVLTRETGRKTTGRLSAALRLPLTFLCSLVLSTFIFLQIIFCSPFHVFLLSSHEAFTVFHRHRFFSSLSVFSDCTHHYVLYYFLFACFNAANCCKKYFKSRRA